MLPPSQALNDDPFSRGLFDKDELTTQARAKWFKVLVLGTMYVVCLLWGVLPLYWATLAYTDNNVHSLSGWVVVILARVAPLPPSKRKSIAMRVVMTDFLPNRISTGER